MTTDSDNTVSADELNEFFARQHGIDGAIRRVVGKRSTPKDVIILETAGVVGTRFDEEKTRIAGVDYRCKSAGSHKRYDATQAAHNRYAAEVSQLEEKLGPKIAELEAQAKGLRKQIADVAEKKGQAAAELAEMDHSRGLLRDKQLPKSFRDIIAQLERPVRNEFKAKLNPLRDKCNSIQCRINAGFGEVDRAGLDAARTELAALEKQQAEELAQVAVEYKNFYIDAIVD